MVEFFVIIIALFAGVVGGICLADWLFRRLFPPFIPGFSDMVSFKVGNSFVIKYMLGNTPVYVTTRFTDDGEKITYEKLPGRWGFYRVTVPKRYYRNLVEGLFTGKAPKKAKMELVEKYPIRWEDILHIEVTGGSEYKLYLRKDVLVHVRGDTVCVVNYRSIVTNNGMNYKNQELCMKREEFEELVSESLDDLIVYLNLSGG